MRIVIIKAAYLFCGFQVSRPYQVNFLSRKLSKIHSNMGIQKNPTIYKYIWKIQYWNVNSDIPYPTFRLKPETQPKFTWSDHYFRTTKNSFRGRRISYFKAQYMLLLKPEYNGIQMRWWTPCVFAKMLIKNVQWHKDASILLFGFSKTHFSVIELSILRLSQ